MRRLVSGIYATENAQGEEVLDVILCRVSRARDDNDAIQKALAHWGVKYKLPPDSMAIFQVAVVQANEIDELL